jgi:hypothetical protein
MDYMAQKAAITGKSYAAVLQNLKEATGKFNDRRWHGVSCFFITMVL